jgi:hypothetical protein
MEAQIMQAAVSVRFIDGRWADAILTTDRAESSDVAFFNMDWDETTASWFRELTHSGTRALPVVVVNGEARAPWELSAVQVMPGCPVDLADLANRVGYHVVSHRSAATLEHLDRINSVWSRAEAMLAAKKLSPVQGARVIGLWAEAQTLHTDGMLPAAWEPRIVEAEQILNTHEGGQADD